MRETNAPNVSTANLLPEFETDYISADVCTRHTAVVIIMGPYIRKPTRIKRAVAIQCYLGF
jgi:hypothetical protein